jgi:hypothetical protein
VLPGKHSATGLSVSANSLVGKHLIFQTVEDGSDSSFIPELDGSFWDTAIIIYPENKKPVTLRLDRDVLRWFRSTGRGYQTRVNAIFKSNVKAHTKG